MEIMASVDQDEVMSKLVFGQSPESIRILYRQLNQGKNQLTRTIQQNVHKNYSEFVRISKEIQKLDTDMTVIHDLIIGMRPLSDTNEISSALDQPVVGETIEGLNGFAELESRNLLLEGGDFIEIGVGESKPCYLTLFSDSLVVASRKAKPYGKTTLSVDNILKLQDLSIIDSPSDSTEINIVCGGDIVMIYRAATTDIKKTWFHAIKRAIDDQSVTNRHLGVAKPSKSLLESINHIPSLLEHSKPSRSINPDVAWLKDMRNELDVFIAHREYGSAISTIEKARNVFQTYSASIPDAVVLRRELESRISTLSEILLAVLQDSSALSSCMQNTIQALVRLGYGTRTRDIFLQKRSDLMHSKLKMLPFEGDTITFIHDFTYLFFVLFRKSVDMYRKYFALALGLTEASGFVHWLRLEIRWYLDQFRLLVFQPNTSFDTIRECLSSAMDGCSLLREVGVDLSYIFVSGMKQDVDYCIEWYFTAAKSRLTKSMSEDEYFELVKIPGISVKFIDSNEMLTMKPFVGTSSTCSIMQVLFQALFRDLRPLLTSSSLIYYTNITTAIISLVEFYSRHLMDTLHDVSTTTKQHIHILLDMSFVHQYFLPFIQQVLERGVEYQPRQFNDIFDVRNPSSSFLQGATISVGFSRAIPELSKFRIGMESMCDISHGLTFLKAVGEIFTRTYRFGSGCCEDNSSSYIDYSDNAFPVNQSLAPSVGIIECFKSFCRIGEMVDEIRRDCSDKGIDSAEMVNLSKKDVLRACLSIFFSKMSDDRNWVDRRFGYSGLHQLILDIHFLLKLVDEHVDKIILKTATDLCSRAMKMYFQQCSDNDRKRVLMSGEWYDAHVSGTLNKST